MGAAGALGGGRVVTYCGGGISATLDAFVLTLLGEPDVAVYDGSMGEWMADPALPIERGEVSTATFRHENLLAGSAGDRSGASHGTVLHR